MVYNFKMMTIIIIIIIIIMMMMMIICRVSCHGSRSPIPGDPATAASYH